MIFIRNNFNILTKKSCCSFEVFRYTIVYPLAIPDKKGIVLYKILSCRNENIYTAVIPLSMALS